MSESSANNTGSGMGKTTKIIIGVVIVLLLIILAIVLSGVKFSFGKGDEQNNGGGIERIEK